MSTLCLISYQQTYIANQRAYKGNFVYPTTTSLLRRRENKEIEKLLYDSFI